MINFNWFKRYRVIPDASRRLTIFQAWDTAQKADELLNAPWVCGTWMVCYDGYYLIDVFRDWMNYPTGKRTVINQALKYNPDVIIIEDKSTGSSLIQELPLEKIGDNGTERPFHYSILGILPDKDKITRMARESVAIEAGKVFIPEYASWLPKFETEVNPFPNSEFKDQIDMLSMSLRYIRERLNYGSIKPEAFGNSVAGDKYRSVTSEYVTVNERESAGMDWD